MKLKYYLRGLGIGMVVTAVIMMVALGNKQPMTDDEVIARAKELGMIENSVLTDIADKDKEPVSKPQQDENQDTEQDAQQDENPDIQQDTQQDENTDENEDKEIMVEETSEPEADVTETVKPETSGEGTMTITVVGGDSSWTVSKRMEEAGLIESAKDFDNHLCSNGYDKRISVGTYDIPTNATYEEMAKIITRMN